MEPPAPEPLQMPQMQGEFNPAAFVLPRPVHSFDGPMKFGGGAKDNDDQWMVAQAPPAVS